MPTTDYESFLAELKSPKFKEMKGAQAAVLRDYAASFVTKNDVAIELPTGAGKTLIALLVAEAWRREGKKAAILSANKTLARQMKQEAASLGIPAVLMEGRGIDIPAADRRGYQRKQQVAIMNYWVYFNQNPVIDPADLIVMDDAHLSEHCLHSLYSVEINRFDHPTLFKGIIAELLLRFPEYAVLADAAEDEPNPSNTNTELLSFIDQTDVTARLREIVEASPEFSSNKDLSFRWNRLRHSLNEASIYLSLNNVWFRPYIYPLTANAHYEQSTQRLYLSATVGDPDDLSRRLGTKTIEKIPVASEFSEKTSGRRLIVMNRSAEADIPARLEAVILTALRTLPKSVWLCSSEADARKYEKIIQEWLNGNGFVGHPTWVLTPLGDEIDSFKAAPAGHLFVAGRFDGMDFKGNECRLVIVTTLPRAINAQEEFISAYLRDSGFMKRRLNHRIVQALGRCNRADDDFGVYVLADRRFVTHLGPDANKEGIPRNIVAEIDMAQDAAEVDEQVLLADVETFLRGDFQKFDAASSSYLQNAPSTENAHLDNDTAADEVLAWTALFHSHNYHVAANRFERCWETARTNNLMEIGALHGWHWAKALYLQALLGEEGARDKALDVLQQALARGGKSSWFNRMRASLNRAKNTSTGESLFSEDYANALVQSFDELLETVGATGSKFEQWCQRLESSLASTSHAEFHDGLEKLAKLLGYHGYRPKHDAATDCRWRGAFGNSREVVAFEGKIEHKEATEITPTDMGQAHIQLSRAKSEFESKGYAVRAVIVTHLTEIHVEAKASAGIIKILSKDAVLALWQVVKTLLSLYRQGWSLSGMEARRSAASDIRPKLPKTGWLLRALNSDSLFISPTTLLAEWKSPAVPKTSIPPRRLPPVPPRPK